jgi:hypothetical protein
MNNNESPNASAAGELDTPPCRYCGSVSVLPRVDDRWYLACRNASFSAQEMRRRDISTLFWEKKKMFWEV